MTINTHKIGRKGEAIAQDFLKEKGYRILETNYRDQSEEIDIIAQDGAAICFIEVKMRNSQRYGHPLESITPNKQRRLARAALRYLHNQGTCEVETRFDVVAILPRGQGDMDIELVKNAFQYDQSF